MLTLGPLLVGIPGTSLSADDREILSHPLVGGVVLFTRNYETTQQLAELTQAIKSVKRPALLITVDHEGGRVQRFREGFSQIPPMGQLGSLYDVTPASALRLAYICGALIACELQQCGVDLSFAPILDIDASASQIIGDRAFHRDPQVVVQLAQAFVSGMDSLGMVAVGKHYPGHGSVVLDTHLEMVTDDRSFDVMMQQDLMPFQQYQKIGLKAMMVAHVIYPQVDRQPAGFSSVWLKDILRRQLHFEGVVISDDLGMAAAKYFGSTLAGTRAAIQAGCDLVLLCNEFAEIVKVIEKLPPLYYVNSVDKIRSLKPSRVITPQQLSVIHQQLLNQYACYQPFA